MNPMTPDDFRELLRSKTAEGHIITEEPGPFTTRDALGLLEAQARATFRLQEDHSLSTIVVGSS